MKNVKRILPFTIPVFLCVGLFGCSDSVTFEWGKFRSDRTIAVFINDSLVVVTDCRRWHKITETWNGGYSEESSCGHDRMMVYNYRVQEGGPRWTDSLTNTRGGWRWNQMTDSVFWRWDGDVFWLWKVGEKMQKKKMIRKNEDCLNRMAITRIHTWIDDEFIAFGNDFSLNEYSCQYAILDTAARTLTYRRLDKDLEWIKNCEDVRGWWDNVYCLRKNIDKSGFFLIVNNEKKDSILIEDVPNTSNLWSYFEFCFMGNMIYFGHNINSVDAKYGKIVVYPNIKATSGLNYIDENDNSVNYEFYWE